MNEKWSELLSFCISSAMGCMDEPPIYGSLRLIDAMERAIRIGQDNKITDSGELAEIADYIEENKLICMYDEEAFRGVLREVALRLITAIQH